MRWPFRLNSLLAQFALRAIAPMLLILVGIIAASVFAYQQVVTALLVDRDRQLAALSAARVTDAVEGYARVLEALANTPDVRSPSSEMRAAALRKAADALQIFSAGVMVADRDGQVITFEPGGPSPLGETVAGQAYFLALQQQPRRAFSDVLLAGSRKLIVVAVPMLDDSKTFAGALLGLVDLDNTALGEAFRQLLLGEEGYAYVVDGSGRVVFHPRAEYVGTEFTDRPFVNKVTAGESGGTLWTSPDGEHLVLGYTPIEGTNWGLIVREPWDSVVGETQVYAALMMLAALAALAVATYLLWRGVRRIIEPIRQLAGQTTRLAAGEPVEQNVESGIAELDALGRAFGRMATQIASYRAGLRRYVGELTRLQEEERRRLARDLHDETIQSLLAMGRRLELHAASAQDPAHQAHLGEIQAMVSDTLGSLRRTTRDLRPFVLEDLGLVAALRTLVRSAREGEGALPHARLDVVGQPDSVGEEQELALYRITQEALNNARRHARATGVRIGLKFEATRVHLEIADDGQGFEVPASLSDLAQRGHFGLMGIQERVWAVGGTLHIDSAPGRGTHLVVAVPVAGHMP